MDRLLELHGQKVVSGGPKEGVHFKDLQIDEVQKYAKRAPGQPDLQRFCRSFLLLTELEEAASTAEVSALAVVRVCAKPKLATSADTEQSIVEVSTAGDHLHGWAGFAWSFFWRQRLSRILWMAWLVSLLLFVCLTSPLMAQTLVAAVAKGIQLAIAGLLDFVSVFHFTLLEKLGLLEQDFQPHLNEPPVTENTPLQPQPRMHNVGDVIDYWLAKVGSVAVGGFLFHRFGFRHHGP
eukprot:TRINITY_DN17374_c0_g1_i1.p1 TRINITY_DN17374_c0_g1~~TRINITY_DN17374_c0_g1_i1.p1  ORF type:complete len:236 (-),score=43.91 TRINITY_DN17374_c0_g1_i1:743-1450(-)